MTDNADRPSDEEDGDRSARETALDRALRRKEGYLESEFIDPTFKQNDLNTPDPIFLVGVSLLLYFVACFTPAALVFNGKFNGEIDMAGRYLFGFDCLYFGFISLLSWWLTGLTGILCALVSLSNVFYVFSLWQFHKKDYKNAFGCSVTAVLLAQFIWLLIGQKCLTDEGGVGYMCISSPFLGFFIWVGSMLVIAVAAKILAHKSLESRRYGNSK